MKPFLSVLVFSIFFTQLCLLSQATHHANSSHHNDLWQRHNCAKEDYSFLPNDVFLIRQKPHRVLPQTYGCDNHFTCHLIIKMPSGLKGMAFDRSDVSWSRASGKPVDYGRFTPLRKIPGNMDVARISNPTDGDQGLYVLRHLQENWVLLFEVTLRPHLSLGMTMPPADYVQSSTDPNGSLIIGSINLPQRVAPFMCRIRNITLHNKATEAIIGLDRLRLTREQALYLVDTSGVQSGMYSIRIVLDNGNQLAATFQIDVSTAGPPFAPDRSPAVVPPHGVSPAHATAQDSAAQHNCGKVIRPVREDYAYSNRTDAEVVQTQILVCPARTDLDETVMMLVCKDWQNQSQVIVSFPNTVLDQSSVVELEHVLCKLNCSIRDNLLTIVVVLGSSVTKRLAIKLNMSAGLFQQLVVLLTPDGCTSESKTGSSTTTPTHTVTAAPAPDRVQGEGKAGGSTVPQDQSSEQTPTSTDTSNIPGNTGMAQEGGTKEGEDDSRSTKALQTSSTASPAFRAPTSIGELLQNSTALLGTVTRMLNIPASSSTAVGKIIASSAAAAAAADAEMGTTFPDGGKKTNSPTADEVTQATYMPSRKPAVDAMTRTDLLPSDPGPHLGTSSAPADQQPTDQDPTSYGTVTLPTGEPAIQVLSATNQVNEEEVPPQDSSSGTPDSIYLSIPVLFGIVLLLVVIVYKRLKPGPSDTPEHRTADTKRLDEEMGTDGGSDATSVDEPESPHPSSSEEDSKPFTAEPTVCSGTAFIPTAASSADYSPTRSPQDGGEQPEKIDSVQETEEADDPKRFSDSTVRDHNIQEELTPSGTPVRAYLGIVGRDDGLATQLLSIQSVQHKTPGMSVEEEGPDPSPWQQHNNIPIACTEDDASRSAPKPI